MALSDQEVKLSLKVMVNRENNRVLFAEADSDFADILLSFLTLPLGKIVRLMDNPCFDEEPLIGSLNRMYDSLKELAEVHFATEGAKQMLLDPESSFSDECSKLKINVDNYSKPQPMMKYFRCGNEDCSRKGSPLITRYHDRIKCDCGEYMNKPMGIGGSKNGDDGDDDSGVFLKKGLSFLITDDLRMAPVAPGCMIQTLLKLGVTIPDGAELLIVTFGLNEIIDLLRASLQSSTPLTDVVFDQYIVKIDGAIWCYMGDTHPVEESSTGYSKKMIVKAWVYKFGLWENTLYLLQAGEDFVDFLLSLLVIPLGGVEWLLGGDTGLKSIDNLYRSLHDCIDENCFRTLEMRSRLMKPKLPPNCLSKNQLMFALEEDVNPKVCYYTAEETSSWMHFKNPKGGESYVKSSAAFVVDYDLVVSNECDFIKTEQPDRSCYKELELHIGLEEAFDILKKSLTHYKALDNSLSNLISEKLSAT